jgi:DivIVA domain-containing protein
VNSDEVRATRFVRSASGYDASQVDGLLGRVAAELDAGRPAGPLIENAKFRGRVDPFFTVNPSFLKRYYDVDSVDWFLGQLLLRPGHAELAGLSDDPWRDLAVAQSTRDRVGERGGRPGNRNYFAAECADAWRNFGQQPGTYLRFERIRSSDRIGSWEFELRTADQQPMAFLRGSPTFSIGGWVTSSQTVSAAGRSFTVSSPKIPARSTVDSWPPGIAEINTRTGQDRNGHYAAGPMNHPMPLVGAPRVSELVDEAGTPVLYLSGDNFNRRACARVTFPDQRWLRFLVRGTDQANAIMTAVDQAGNKVARYRHTGRGFHLGAGTEIAVHPDRELTLELILAIAISEPLVTRYFAREQGAGVG